MNQSNRKSIRKELQENHFRVSIFGSARTTPKDKEYKEVFTFAKKLGKLGVDVVTGGGPGAMEAANKGHKAGTNGNNKIHSIGLNIELPSEQKPNKSLDISETFATFSERLDNFMLLSNAAVITPGGVGTLLEFLYTWQLVQVNKICRIPIILVGPMWKGLLKWFEKELVKRKYFDKNDLKHLLHADDFKEAYGMIKQAHNVYLSDRTNFCITSKRYKMI